MFVCLIQPGLYSKQPNSLLSSEGKSGIEEVVDIIHLEFPTLI